jgi:hypothetical protein
MAGLGIRDAALLFLLGSIGILREKAIALSLLMYSVSMLLTGALGGLLEGRRLLSPILKRD